ncbi:hypothetical protein KFE25_012474 [Diacronema lutheri]|uniref:Tyrosine specific protein phosphatases domain-containing protein n=1 Tax=Diacronema lutheri TaxID=2081491 RepID=A0A8J6CBH6_DIALT|nr:hypothetical protein KFE25_012474 [Diacronema lutheri]|mmetsp:Transcript_16741/g.52037  ORF Transcript_16741/g.52037 Transcript_16741/m.52037 type:complete len:281 (-) Transcript_16741:154-996(-)
MRGLGVGACSSPVGSGRRAQMTGAPAAVGAQSPCSPLAASRLSAIEVQVASSQFSAEGVGHAFELRRPISRVTARKCAACGEDIKAHSRAEVMDETLLVVLDATAEERASVILDGELMVGGFKTVATECAHDERVVVINCAGTRLHAFMPRTAAPFDALRTAGRLRDLEWEDSEKYKMHEEELLDALRWARQQTQAGNPVLVNCAQGQSRSGAFATAYLMATRDISAAEALESVQAKRPLVQPNTGFVAQLAELETVVRSEGRKWKMLPRLLTRDSSPRA